MGRPGEICCGGGDGGGVGGIGEVKTSIGALVMASVAAKWGGDPFRARSLGKVCTMHPAG